MFFLAQLYDYQGDIGKAIEFSDLAISHTPTAVELYMTKARILKVILYLCSTLVILNRQCKKWKLHDLWICKIGLSIPNAQSTCY